MRNTEVHQDSEYVFSVTREGLEKIADYITQLEAKRKEILDAGLDTAEDALPTVGDIINDIQFSYDDEFKEYCNGWSVTDEYDADYPLQLELNKDFVKTKVSQVERLGMEPDDDVWVTIKQGNRVGCFITSVGKLDERRRELEQLEQRYGGPNPYNNNMTDEKVVRDMIALGDILDVPNLKDLPLIDEQSHALQVFFRLSSQDETGGCIYIHKDNYHELLHDALLDNLLALQHFSNAPLESVVQVLKDDVRQFPQLEGALRFVPMDKVAAEGGNIIIYPEFPTYFSMRDKGFRDMVCALDDCVREIAFNTSFKDAGNITLEESLEKRDISKDDLMELMHNAAKSKVIHVGTDRVAGVLKWDTQQDRKYAEKVLSSWMSKPGKKIAKDINDIKARGEAKGR